MKTNKSDFVTFVRGLDVGIAGVPDTTLTDVITTDRAALSVNEGGERRTTLNVAVGDRVKLGQALLSDRDCSGLNHTAPVCGTVMHIEAASRRRIKHVVIAADGEEAVAFPQHTLQSLEALEREEIRDLLLTSGSWSALRARPFNRIALPHAVPQALFVTALDTNPLAPDPNPIVAAQGAEFEIGLVALAKLTGGPTYVCCAPNFTLQLPERASIHALRFAGPHPAGLPGTHIHSVGLDIKLDCELWHVGYQDVIAIGKLLLTGRLSPQRIVALGGPAAARPRLLRVIQGVDLSWCKAETNGGAYRIISGSILDGTGSAQYLGRYHNQITLLPEPADEPRPRAWRGGVQNWCRGAGASDAVDTRLAGRPCGMLPLEVFESVWPFNTPPAALLRALLSGDVDSAVELGCIGLAAEDLALCSYLCPAKRDYGAALRATLNLIERQR